MAPSGLTAQRLPFISAELGPDVEPLLWHLCAALPRKSAPRFRNGQRKRSPSPRPAGRSLATPRLDAGRGAANAAATAGADAHAAAIMPAIREAQAGRAKTLRDIAPALNARGIPTHAAASDDGAEYPAPCRIGPPRSQRRPPAACLRGPTPRPNSCEAGLCLTDVSAAVQL